MPTAYFAKIKRLKKYAEKRAETVDFCGKMRYNKKVVFFGKYLGVPSMKKIIIKKIILWIAVAAVSALITFIFMLYLVIMLQY